ncbi:protein UmuD-like [Ylistrum balloti]|uniref:protein UmuD-like n=1 Tax=Ylistrum balloti TaxID=509963 RepID=UPI0029059596|nr:protein UmuD-like [Ylistrum balloti]
MKAVRIPTKDSANATHTILPLIENPVQAGFPSPGGDYEEKELDFNTLLVQHPAATFCLRVEGDSMSEAGIDTGDILVVDRSLVPQHNDIVVASINNEFTLKRFIVTGGVMFLHAENKHYPDIEIQGSMELLIFGVVSSVIKQFRK